MTQIFTFVSDWNLYFLFWCIFFSPLKQNVLERLPSRSPKYCYCGVVIDRIGISWTQFYSSSVSSSAETVKRKHLVQWGEWKARCSSMSLGIQSWEIYLNVFMFQFVKKGALKMIICSFLFLITVPAFRHCLYQTMETKDTSSDCNTVCFLCLRLIPPH